MSRQRMQRVLGLCGSIGLIFSFLNTGVIAIPTVAAHASVAAPLTGSTLTLHTTPVSMATLLRRAAPASQTSGGHVTPLGVLPRTTASVRGGVVPHAITPRTGTTPLPQTIASTVAGLPNTSGFVPPDTMGAVGPAQILFAVNGQFRAINKTAPYSQVFTISDQTFWGTAGSAAASGVSDPHVRYDSTSGRWFITEIDTPTGDNHILLAVSNSATLSSSTAWSLYAIPGTGTGSAQDQGCFADYDTPGIDANALYIGANMFGGVAPCAGGYLHANAYIVANTAALSTGTADITTFYNLGSGIFTPQGVDSSDASTVGHLIGVNESTTPVVTALTVITVNPPSLNPTLTLGSVALPQGEFGAMGGVPTANSPTRRMDDIDDRLFSATLRNGHLWTAHNVAVDATGTASASGTRDAVRWYDIAAATMTVNQWGTIFDPSTTGTPFNYWMGTMMVSGQGHAVMGMNRANANSVVVAGVVGRLVADPAGQMSAFTPFITSTTDNYNDSSFNSGSVNRWGDFTYTSLDPCDNMTMWTVQEYISGPSGPGSGGGPQGWATEAAQLLAPPPAQLPASLSLPIGQSGLTLPITGSAPNGQGFYDTPNTLTDPCRKRLTASASNGVVVNGVTYLDPTHVTLTVDTSAAVSTTAVVTLTNPDGQAVTTTLSLTGATTTGIPLAAGWNLVAVPLTSSTGLTGQTVLPQILAASHGAVGELASWTGASWNVALDTAGSLSGSTVPLAPGQGYFLYSDAPTTLALTGLAVTSPPTVAMQAGWNLIGLPTAPLTATATTVLASAQNAGVQPLEIAQWTGTQWQVVLAGITPPAGQDFAISRTAGYFLYAQAAGSWTQP